MDTNVHLLIKTEDKPAGQFIGRINSKYARYYNKKYNYIGHLFQDRYFSEIIESDEQILETSRYIHLNPIKANMVEKPEDYKYSSYKMYIGYNKVNFISPNIILCYFKEENKRELYKNFVERSISIQRKNNNFITISNEVETKGLLK